MAKSKQKSKPLTRVLGSALPALITGMTVGLYAGVRLAEAATATETLSFGWFILAIAWLILGVVFALFAQVVLHEAGHLVCGLATGYKFCSFRIGSLQWQKENGRLCLRRMHLAGTGGQCLLAPPALVDGKMPYILYNLGGPLANLVTAAVFELLAMLCRKGWQLALEPTPLRARLPMTWLEIGVWMLTALLDLLAIVGLAFGLTNGIPLRIGGLDNDGRNALSLGKDPAALRALWVQLTVNERQTRGVRLKDMPAEWFALPSGAELANPMTASLAVFAENRLMDAHCFADAVRLIDGLAAQNTAIPGLYQNLLLCDRLYCALLAGEDTAALRRRWDAGEMQAFRKQMKTFLAVLRTEYAAALLLEQDAAKAEALLARFEKCAKTHPSPSDVASERELLELARRAASSRSA